MQTKAKMLLQSQTWQEVTHTTENTFTVLPILFTHQFLFEESSLIT